MKKRTLLASCLTIALCLCLIAGSTYALFTDSTQFNIAVTSGDVELLATAGITNVFSAKGCDAEHSNPYLTDEKGNCYVHDRQEPILGRYFFKNGGEAKIASGSLSVVRITPGDRVDVAIKVDNKSNVAIAYRYKITAVESNLAKEMVVTIDGVKYRGLESWTSDWFLADATEGVGAAIEDKIISIELPVYVDEECQSEGTRVQSATFTITVEAVQGNAITDAAPPATLLP